MTLTKRYNDSLFTSWGKAKEHRYYITDWHVAIGVRYCGLSAMPLSGNQWWDCRILLFRA